MYTKNARWQTLAILMMVAFAVQAQSPQYLPGSRGYEINDRWDVLHWKSLSQKQHSGVGNISRKAIVYEAQNAKLRKVVLEGSNLPDTSTTTGNTVKQAVEQIYDGVYGRDSVQIQGIMRIAGGISEAAGYSSKDVADASYILTDNVEYAKNYDHSLEIYGEAESAKKYEKDGVFYSVEKIGSSAISYAGERAATGWNWLNTFYKTPANFYEAHVENLDIVVNPMIHFSYGAAADDENIVFRNVRGIEARGIIADEVYFYTNIVETQARFNNFMERRISRFRSIPGQGLYKTYESGVIDNLKGWDFLNSQAYIGTSFAKETISVEFGHGKHSIGNGIRSLILSDYGNNYLYLKFNTRIWKFQYQNIFAELAPISGRFNIGDTVLPKKYMANHYLTFSPRKNMEIGLFETVVFSRENQFELQYLNPIILYRTVEQFLDSPDNVLIGLTGKWNILKGVQLYGQLILDEFKLSELTAGNGWWANKYGLQTGIKYYNVANIDHLDLQVEYNTVRPYTYTHRDTLEGFPNQSVANYTHYNQPLAHPLGANFKEIVVDLRYRPVTNLFIKARAVRAFAGQDPTGQNFGGNPLLPLETREMDFGNRTGQGIETDINILRLDVSYQLDHNYFIDLNYLMRNEDATDDALDITTNYIGLGLRVNVSQIQWDY